VYNLFESFQVLTAASTNMTAFWAMATCSLVEVDRRFSPLALFITLSSPLSHWPGQDPTLSAPFRYLHRLFARLIYHPDDGRSNNLWKVGLLQRDYTAIYARKLSSSGYIYDTKLFTFMKTLWLCKPIFVDNCSIIYHHDAKCWLLNAGNVNVVVTVRTCTIKLFKTA
jgi:hypothetical protein